jgi:phage major head subunit gpT-like protein
MGSLRPVFRFEQYGQAKALVGGLGPVIPKGKNKLVWQLFTAAATTLCYDGQNMVDTDHVEGNSGTQSNKLTGALTATTFNQARTLMRRFKDDNGEYTGHGYGRLMLMVPQELEATAMSIVNADLYVSGGAAITNPDKGKATVFVNPFLTDATDWYLVDLDSPVPPIILQEVGSSDDVGIVTDTKGGETDFMRDFVHFGTPVTHFNAGFGDWRSVVGNIVAG